MEEFFYEVTARQLLSVWVRRVFNYPFFVIQYLARGR
jgi:hypothetical protein